VLQPQEKLAKKEGMAQKKLGKDKEMQTDEKRTKGGLYGWWHPKKLILDMM